MKQTVPLGHTDIEISSIGLGCWQFSGGKGLAGGYWEGQSRDQSRSIVKAALDSGINWFDTAEAYGRGESEQTLSDALQAAGIENGQIVVATKWMPFFRTARSIGKTFPRRQEALRPYGIDLHQIHAQASLSSIEKQADAMADLAESGHISAIGVSNFSADAMRRFHEVLVQRGLALSSNQVRYSLLDRRIEQNGTLDAAKELGITIIAYSPLEQGILTGKFHENPDRLNSIRGLRRFTSSFKKRSLERTRPLVEALNEVATRHDASAAQAALAWVIGQHGRTVVAIPGASSPGQVQSNAAAMALHLTSTDLDTIDEAMSRAGS